MIDYFDGRLNNLELINITGIRFSSKFLCAFLGGVTNPTVLKAGDCNIDNGLLKLLPKVYLS